MITHVTVASGVANIKTWNNCYLLPKLLKTPFQIVQIRVFGSGTDPTSLLILLFFILLVGTTLQNIRDVKSPVTTSAPIFELLRPFDHGMILRKFRDDRPISNGSRVISCLVIVQTDKQTHKQTSLKTIPPSLREWQQTVLITVTEILTTQHKQSA